MDVMRYAVVIQLMELAALKSEPITAYVDAVIVPSKPERKTLQNIAVSSYQHCSKKVMVSQPGRSPAPAGMLLYLPESNKSPGEEAFVTTILLFLYLLHHSLPAMATIHGELPRHSRGCSQIHDVGIEASPFQDF